MQIGFKLNKIYRTGYCVGRGIIADRTRGWEKVRFYTRCFLIEHKDIGLVLIDTGYGDALLESTHKGINSLYRTLLPFTYSHKDSIVGQLAQDGISVKDLSYLIITHYHPDHIGALTEFASVPWIYRKDTLEGLLKLSPLRGLVKGFIRTLMPSVPKGSIPIVEDSFTDKWNSFRSFDLFEDGSLHLIDLPGHAVGQMGVAIQDTLFAADAKWGGNGLPHKLGLLVQEDPKVYQKTFEALGKLSPQVNVIPTHTIEEAYA